MQWSWWLNKAEEKPRNIKSEMIKLIRDSDTVRREWSKIAAEWEPEESHDMVTDLRVTMRDFSYASEWMEKVETGKNLSKNRKHNTSCACRSLLCHTIYHFMP